MFIALEGIDGSGKSTQVQELKENLERAGHSVYTTCEPTTEEYGREIREIFSGQKRVDQHTIAALFLADRLEHILRPDHGMLAHISAGHIVISDRYYLSSYAYHGAHVDMDWVIQLNTKPAEFLRPDLHIYLDIPVERAMERIQETREQIEIYETHENLQKVYDAYELAIDKVSDTENIVRIAADRDPQVVADAVWDAVSTIIPQ